MLGATWLVQRFTRAELVDGLSWWDVLGLSLLAGDDHVKIGIMAGSLLSALLATVVLRIRKRAPRARSVRSRLTRADRRRQGGVKAWVRRVKEPLAWGWS